MTSKPFAPRLAELRDKIISTQAELATLPDQPLPAADALARLDAWIASEAARFDPTQAARSFTDQVTRINILEAQGLRNSDASVLTDMAPMLCSLFGPEIRARLGEAIKALPLTPGPALKDRPARLQHLRDELDRLERGEERLIREAEAAGEPLERRGDARPELVLLPDGML